MPVGIELFAGCGGLSTGFLDAGLRVVAGFELDARAVEAFNYNHAHRGATGILADLAGASGHDVLRAAGLQAVDFVVAGPPCQPFSIAGKQGGTADARAFLLFDCVRIIGELSPSAFLIENVPNLLSFDNGALLRSAISPLMKRYAVRAEVVTASQYGVAQNRKRLVILGLRDAEDVSFPAPTHGIPGRPVRTASDAIGDLPDAAEFGECGIHNHEPTMHSADMVRRFRGLAPGRREQGSFHDRLHADRPSFTLRAGSGNFSPLRPIHYRFDRVITARESARLQGFSDDFIWPDSIPRLQQYRQIGNAVPPPLAFALARSLAAQMRWKAQPQAFLGDPTGRPNPRQLSDDERRRARLSRLRGASLGKVPELTAEP
ncbi:MAG TPA: DNA cytosine methyltransferase [Rubrivivax sp.]|nr:DNA cytosine methyltransferase [Rubrivivax sp.]